VNRSLENVETTDSKCLKGLADGLSKLDTYIVHARLDSCDARKDSSFSSSPKLRIVFVSLNASKHLPWACMLLDGFRLMMKDENPSAIVLCQIKRDGGTGGDGY